MSEKINFFKCFIVGLIIGISSPVDAQDQEEIIYKRVDSTILKMNIYYPAEYDSLQSYPAIVFFFGGGWVAGSVKQFEHQAKYFSQRGAVCFLADYRVENRNGTTPFESLKDAKSAMRYVRTQTAIRIDSTKIVAAGASAGGHLAAAVALVNGFDEEGEDRSVSTIPAALVLFNPVVDNGPSGYGYPRIGEAFKEFSPLHNVRSGAPPAIFFMGTKDHIIPVETAEYFSMSMTKVGSRCELKLYENEGHGFFNYKFRENYERTISQTDKFLQSLDILEEKTIGLK